MEVGGGTDEVGGGILLLTCLFVCSFVHLFVMLSGV